MASPLASLSARYGSGPLVVACAVPFLFLHRHYQPTVSAGGFDVTLSDVAVLAVVVAAVLEWRRGGRVPGGRALWCAWAALLAWIAVSTLYGRLLHDGYPLRTHAVTALKFAEYALLAPAAALLLRGGRARPLLTAAVAWSVVVTTVGCLQFLGVLPEFEGRRPGQREPSLVGIHDFAAFSGAVLVLALVAIATGRRSRTSVASGIAGGLGVGVAAALDSVGGLVLMGVLVVAAAWRRHATTVRRTAGVVLTVLAVSALAVVLRASSIHAFLRFVGLEEKQRADATRVESYAHRAVLASIGVDIWVDHPLLGVGWQGSGDAYAYGPQLPAARERFPAEPAEAFPSPEHPWGVQNAPLQALADMGPLGLVLFLAVFAVPGASALRRVVHAQPEDAAVALVAVGWLVFALANFTGSGLVSGASVDAQLWLGFALVASFAGSALASRDAAKNG